MRFVLVFLFAFVTLTEYTNWSYLSKPVKIRFLFDTSWLLTPSEELRVVFSYGSRVSEYLRCWGTEHFIKFWSVYLKIGILFHYRSLLYKNVGKWNLKSANHVFFFKLLNSFIVTLI